MRSLAEYPLEGHEESSSMASTFSDGSTDFKMAALSWVDGSRRYFVVTYGKTTAWAERSRLRWLKRDGVSAQERQVVPMPYLVLDYYSCASMIERHKITRKDILGIERSFQRKEFSMRVSATLLGMCVTGAFFSYVGSRGVTQHMS